MKRIIKRGEIYIANLNPAQGSEQGKERRVLVISNDVGNRFSPVILAVPITTEITDARKKMPQFVLISPDDRNGQTKEGLIDCGQIRVLDVKARLKDCVGTAGKDVMKMVDSSLKTSLQLCTCPKCKNVWLPGRDRCAKCKYVLYRECNNCGVRVRNEHRYCHNCGSKKEGNE